ncbi:hypothetical protein D3C85_1366800 [compost metagenome]
MRQLVHRDRGAGRTIGVEVLAVDLIVSTEVVHVDQECTDFHHVGERGAGGGQDVADVLDDGACLHADVQRGGAHRVDLGARDAVVGQARAGAGDEQEAACALDMGILAAGRGRVQSLMQTLVGSV